MNYSMRNVFFIFSVFFTLNVVAQPFVESPVTTVQRVGDKLIRETPFAYKLEVARASNRFDNMKFVNFRRTFGKCETGTVAYAYTQLSSTKDTVMLVELEHNDACKIWCNDSLVYEKHGAHDIHIVRGERSLELSFCFQLPLKKGDNDLLVKSESGDEEWGVFIQPPSENDAVLAVAPEYPNIGLEHVDHVSSQVAELTNWLVIGPFEPGMERVHDPELVVEFGKMYEGLDEPVTWSIPKVEVLGDMIDPKPWGTTYQWNYHNGGVAWAMQHLAKLTGDERYDDWAVNFCDYHMEGLPFVDYQVNKLNAYNSANALVINSTLLDFTLAPSLPLIYRLRKENDFKNRPIYERYIDKMIEYARFGQIRSEGMTNYTRDTPEKYTVWVDDMFMGIPFLIQAGLYTDSEALRKELFDDAANQVLDFNKHVWNKDTKLYMHANYTSRPEVKLPHWSRANGWAVWAMSDVLMCLPETHPKYKKILKQYRTFVNSLLPYQAESGFWHNVINRPDSPEEVSGTAIFAMALARGIRYGWLDKEKYTPAVLRAWQAVASEIEPDGTVHDICVGTMCSEDENYYVQRPFYDDDTHGSFAVIFAGIEVQKMLDQMD